MIQQKTGETICVLCGKTVYMTRRPDDFFDDQFTKRWKVKFTAIVSSVLHLLKPDPMKPCIPTLIFISLLMILSFVTTITVLSYYGIPHKKAEFKIHHHKINEQNKYAMSDKIEYDESPEE